MAIPLSEEVFRSPGLQPEDVLMYSLANSKHDVARECLTRLQHKPFQLSSACQVRLVMGTMPSIDKIADSAAEFFNDGNKFLVYSLLLRGLRFIRTNCAYDGGLASYSNAALSLHKIILMFLVCGESNEKISYHLNEHFNAELPKKLIAPNQDQRLRRILKHDVMKLRHLVLNFLNSPDSKLYYLQHQIWLDFNEGFWKKLCSDITSYLLLVQSHLPPLKIEQMFKHKDYLSEEIPLFMLKKLPKEEATDNDNIPLKKLKEYNKNTSEPGCDFTDQIPLSVLSKVTRNLSLDDSDLIALLDFVSKGDFVDNSLHKLANNCKETEPLAAKISISSPSSRKRFYRKKTSSEQPLQTNETSTTADPSEKENETEERLTFHTCKGWQQLLVETTPENSLASKSKSDFQTQIKRWRRSGKLTAFSVANILINERKRSDKDFDSFEHVSLRYPTPSAPLLSRDCSKSARKKRKVAEATTANNSLNEDPSTRNTETPRSRFCRKLSYGSDSKQFSKVLFDLCDSASTSSIDDCFSNDDYVSESDVDDDCESVVLGLDESHLPDFHKFLYDDTRQLECPSHISLARLKPQLKFGDSSRPICPIVDSFVINTHDMQVILDEMTVAQA